MFQYSVAISPPDAVIEQVRQLKQQLRAAIGWYSSVNALAHITINLFRADAHTIAQWEAYIAGFAAQQQPLSLQFHHTGAFPNGAFFLAPSETSEQQLIPIMKAFHQQAPLPADATSAAPHMSIARRLTPEQLSVA